MNDIIRSDGIKEIIHSDTDTFWKWNKECPIQHEEKPVYIVPDIVKGQPAGKKIRPVDITDLDYK